MNFNDKSLVGTQEVGKDNIGVFDCKAYPLRHYVTPPLYFALQNTGEEV